MKIELKDKKVFFENNGLKKEIHPFWLRERVNGDNFVDKISQQRLFDPTEITENTDIKNLNLSNDCLEVTFDDGTYTKLAVENILREFPQNSSVCVREKFAKEGMVVKTGVTMEGLKQINEQTIRVNYLHGGKKETLETKFLFHALGRKPSTDGLNLEEIGVELESSGHVRTNAFQQSSIPHIYAAGDCAGPHEIVHVAIRQGETAAMHALGKSPKAIAYDSLLGVVFTDPQVATVGYRTMLAGSRASELSTLEHCTMLGGI